MSATEANPRVPADIRESQGTAAQVGAPLESARANAVSMTEATLTDAIDVGAIRVVIRLTKITIILPSGGPMAYMSDGKVRGL